ncbi:MAG TPA: ABC transporter substrate-binding protein [Firmicutes bacterium]|nr:ABC transporter substrate-binding protein [Bacillota bacterium]
MNGRKFARYLAAWSMVLAILAAITVGCSQTQPSKEETKTEPEAEPIKIGVIEPLTGPVAAAGTAVRDGALIARDEINGAGGINGRPIELIIEDSANDPATASSAANKLITRDNVVAMMAAWGSSPTLAVVPICRDNKVPQIVETASSFKVTDRNQQGNPWTFRLNAPSRIEAASLKEGLVKDLGFKKVMFLSVNNDWGRGAILDYTPVVKDGGGEIVGQEFFEQDETNFTPILTRVKQSPADSVILTTDAAQVALIADQAHNLGLKVKILVTGGSCFLDKVIKLVGAPACEGLMASLMYAGAYDPSLAANPEKARYFNEEWKKRGHDWVEVQEAARGYDAIWTLAEASKTLPPDQVTGEGIRDALTKVHVKGIMFGDISFGEWGDFINQNAAPAGVAVVKDGQPVVLMKPVVPKP